MMLQRSVAKFLTVDRRLYLGGAAVLACAFVLYWFTGFERGLRAPEDSTALHRVRDVSLDDIRKTGRVAPAFVDRLDVDLAGIPAAERKQAFFRVAMPLVARETTGFVPNAKPSWKSRMTSRAISMNAMASNPAIWPY